MCGEKRGVTTEEIQYMGSPPRVRGKVNFLLLLGLGVGITPACAGKSDNGYNLRHFTRDHPRVCGEKRGHF